MSEWKEYKLKDICLKITDGSHKSPKAQSSGYPMFSVKDMEEYGFNYNDCKLISSEDFAEMKSTGCVPEKDDILIAKDGSYLKQIFICKESKEEAILSSIAIFRPDKNIIEPRFLMYLLKSPQVFNYIKTNCVSGSAIPRIVLKSFKDVSMRVPESITEQKRISNFLEEIDNKIITNRRICENLEVQAQALFKHWFIDFAPFKNGKFVESEVGMIPEGWRVGTLGEICCFSGSKINISDLSLETYYSTENMLPNKGGVTTAASLPATETTTACFEYDVLVSNIRPYFKKIFRAEKISGCSNDVMCFHPMDSKWNTLLYCILYDDKFFAYVMSGSKGTKMPRGDKKQIMKYTIIVPADDELRGFSQIVEPMFRLVQKAKQESSRLSTLRDTLLPKLMSGEIKV